MTTLQFIIGKRAMAVNYKKSRWGGSTRLSVLTAMIAAGLSACMTPTVADAASGTWASTTNGAVWSNGSNWASGIADGAGFTADFSTLNITADLTVNLDSARTIGNLIFGDTTVSNNWTLANNANAADILTLDNTGGTGAPKITVKNAGTTISTELDGTQGLILTGGTTSGNVGAGLVLSGPNNYSGGTTINSTAGSGTFQVYVTNNTSFGTGDVTFNPTTSNRSRLVFGNGVTVNNNFILNSINGPTGGSAAIMVGNLTAFSGGTATINGDASATINGTITVRAITNSGGTFAGAQPTTIGNNYGATMTNNYLTFAGPINVDTTAPGPGPGGTMAPVAKSINGASMTGIIQRAGNVRYSGGGSYYRDELRSGIAQVGADNGIATNAYMEMGGNSNTNPANYAIVDLNGHNQTLVGLSNYISNGNCANVTNTSLITPATLTLAPKPDSDINGRLWFTSGGTGTGTSATITNASPNAPLNVVMNGAPNGTQYLTAPMSGYTGSTTLTSGTLAINSVANGGATHTLTTTNGSTAATVDDATGLAVGQVVTGVGVRTFTTNGGGTNTPITIAAINGLNITLSQNANASGANLTAFGTGNGLGISSSAASNLVFNGGTLAYVGNAVDLNNATVYLNGTNLTPSTNRNFTINSASSGTIDVENSFNTGTSVTTVIAMTMSGASANTTGLLNKTGPGTLILTGANQHTGGTNVNAGTLLVNSPGSLSTGTVSVANLASLGGNGTIGGTVSLANGSVLAPGNPSVNTGVGTLTTGGLTLNAGSISNIEFGVGNDQITVSNAGGLAVNGGNFNLYNAGATTAFSTNGTYTLLNINGGFSGSLSNLTVTNPVAGKNYSLTSTATAVQLTIANTTTSTWTGSGTWTTAGNWSNGVPNAAGVTAQFLGQGSSLVDLSASAVTVGGLVFDGASYTLSGAGGSLALNNNAAASAVTVNNGSQTISVPVSLAKASSIAFSNSSSLTISGVISGGQAINLSGSGTLTLTANDSYSTTSINGSTLNVGTFGGSDTTGTLGSNDVTLSNSGTLNFNRSNSYSFGGAIAGSGVGAGSVDQLGTGTTTIAGAINNVTMVNVSAGALNASSSISQSGGINVTGSGSLTVGGSVSGNGALVVNTSGTVTFNASNSYGGGTTITSGNVILNAAGALPALSALGVNGGTLDLHGNNISLSRITDTGAGGIIKNDGPAVSTSTITFSGALTQNYDLYAALNDGALGGKVAIATSILNTQTFQVPPWIVHFHSTGTYSGGTTVNSQSIEADANNAFGSGPITVATNNGSTNWSQVYIAQGSTIHNNITIGQGKPTPGAGGTFGVIQSATGVGDATVVGSVTINANNFDGGLFNGPLAGGTEFLNINGPVIAAGTANTIIQIGGNVKYGDATGTSSYATIQVNGQADLGTNNALCQTAVLQMSASTTGGASTGTFDLNGFDQTVKALFATSGTLASTVQNSGAGTNTLTLNTTAANDTAGTNTFNGAINGNINVTVGGTGTQKLTNVASSYTGITTVTGTGVLEATSLTDGGSSIGSSTAAANLVFDGGTLRYVGTESAVTTSRGFTINNGKTAIIDVNNAATNLTLSGNSTTSGGTAAGFTKAGLGTLTLTGTHAYTGTTTVSAGTLMVNTSLTNTSAVNIASGAILAGTGTVGGTVNHNQTNAIINPGAVGGSSGATLSFSGAFTLNGGTVQYDVDNTLTNPQDIVHADGGLTIGAGPSKIDLEFLNPASAPASAFDYVLFTYGGADPTIPTNSLNGVTNLLARTNVTFNVNTSLHEVIAHVTTASSANLNWTGSVNGTWDVNTTANWFNTGSSSADKFFNGDTITFPNGASNPTITLNSTANPGSITFSATSLSYTIAGTGSIGGTGAMIVSGTSPVTIKTNNTYSGGTTINAGGTLDVGGAGTKGTLGTGDVTNNGTLKFTRTDGNGITPVTFVNNITGTGDLFNTCPGATVMSGTISQNSLTLNGSGSTTLSGSVTVTGGVTVNGNTTSVAQGLVTTGTGISVSNTANLTASGGVTGAGGITISGTTSFVTVGGTSSYNGNTVISGGTFFTNDATALGNTTGTTTVNSPGSLFCVAQNADYGAEVVTINGTGTGNNGALHAGGATTSTFENTITLGSDSLINLDGGATLALTAVTNGTSLSGAHALSLAGGGTISISGNVTGVTGINTGTTGSTLAFAPPISATLTISTPISGGGNIATNTLSALQGSDGTVALTANNSSFTGNINVNSGNLLVTDVTQIGNGAGRITEGGGAGAVYGALQLAPTSGSMTVANPMTFGGRDALTPNVPQIQNISGNNTVSGAITVATGGANYTLQSDAGTLTVQSGISTASLGAFSSRFLNLQGAGNGILNGVLADTPNPTTGNPVTVVKSGSGKWTLGASSTLNGDLILNDTGTLAISGVHNETFAGVLNVNSGTPHLDLGTGASTVALANSSAQTWAGTSLGISNWTYGTDHLQVGVDNTGLTGAQLSQINFDHFQPGASIHSNTGNIGAVGEITPIVGNVNQDSAIDIGDVGSLMIGLANPANLQASIAVAHPGFTASDTKFVMDVNLDGSADNRDLQAEIVGLANGGVFAPGGGSLTAVPEPATIALFGLGGFLLVASRIRSGRKI
jgi:autotransporter-associated beta strand protein